VTSYISPELVRATMQEHRRRADEHALARAVRATHRRRAQTLLGWLRRRRPHADPGAPAGPEVVWLGSRRRGRPGARPPRAA
jgi:hypothetical protein